MFQQFAMNKPIASADALQESAFGAVVKEGDAEEGECAAASEDEAKTEMLNEC